MQSNFSQPICQISTRLAGIALAGKLRRYLPGSFFLGLSVAAGMLWLAMSGF